MYGFSVFADYNQDKVVVQYDPTCTGPRNMIHKLSDLGYTAELWDTSDGQHNARKYVLL